MHPASRTLPSSGADKAGTAVPVTWAETGQRPEGGQIKSFGVQEKKRFHPGGFWGRLSGGDGI